MQKLLFVIVLVMTAARAEGAEGLSGFIGADFRMFAETPILPGQRANTISPSLFFQPEYRYEWNGGKDRITAIPFLRLEYDDARRRHFDVRELNWLHVGSDWDLLVGVNKVFWGVTEARHLVDIINQTDLVEDPDEEDKLGQPMVNLAFQRENGTLSLFLLPYFRERTFPGPRGRFRAAIPVDIDRSQYGSSLHEWHPDLAARLTLTRGDWDIGLAQFWGTTREPIFLVRLNKVGRLMAIPRYDIINQTSLDLLGAKGNWLWKLESMTRGGQGERFAAVVAGFEYMFTGVFGSAIDLSALAEYLYDDRNKNFHWGSRATLYDDDFFGGIRLGFNDVQSTNLLAGVVVDRVRQTVFTSVEASRRIGERWTIELTARSFSNVPPTDVLFSLRRDDYLQIRVARYF